MVMLGLFFSGAAIGVIISYIVVVIAEWKFCKRNEEDTKVLPPVTPTRAEIESKTEQFAKWVAEEVIDEELWELNYGAFGEIACRKLEKLGIVRAKGDEWVLVEQEESEG